MARIQVYSVRNLVNQRLGNPLVSWHIGQTADSFVRSLKAAVGASANHNLRIEVDECPQRYWTTSNMAGFCSEVDNFSELIVTKCHKRKPSRIEREIYHLKKMEPTAVAGVTLSLPVRKNLRRLRALFEQVFGSCYYVLSPVLVCCLLCGNGIHLSTGGTISTFNAHVRRTHKN